MQVITTHLNADFDCLASMVAAHKLYPTARLVFSGSAERAVQDYLKAVPLPLSQIKDIDLALTYTRRGLGLRIHTAEEVRARHSSTKSLRRLIGARRVYDLGKSFADQGSAN